VQKGFLVAASLAGLTAVILGAFGAHALRPLMDSYQQTIWDKGVQYQIYHALAIFACAMYLKGEYSVLIRNAGICFILGIFCFSGSLYLLATRELTHLPAIVLGPITPIGGFFFIAGWGLILVQAVKKN
jgi:uncharacterized membrane protein YgdD (TMEM256/DUF423 family)